MPFLYYRPASAKQIRELLWFGEVPDQKLWKEHLIANVTNEEGDAEKGFHDTFYAFFALRYCTGQVTFSPRSLAALSAKYGFLNSSFASRTRSAFSS